MRHFFYIIPLLFAMLSCGQSSMKTEEIEYIKDNQDQFTFLVFDKSQVDTFMSKYAPLNFGNNLLKQDILQLTKSNLNSNELNGDSSFSKNTNRPDSSDFNLAKTIIKATCERGEEDHFQECLNYLFFNKCLPKDFQNKWTQTFQGDFRFNASFFATLRDKCQVFDNLIYGEIGHWDEELMTIFNGHIFNEITPDIAQQIKELIEKDKSFDDIEFKKDRTYFIYFLEMTIKKEWRMILIDWN